MQELFCDFVDCFSDITMFDKSLEPTKPPSHFWYSPTEYSLELIIRRDVYQI